MGTRDHARAREGGPKRQDWLCRTCKATDGTPFKNFGSRDACFRCNVAKGKCFKVNVAARPPQAPRALAQRQVSQQRSQQREADKVAKLQAELQRYKKLVKDNTVTDEDAEEAEVEEQVFEYTVEELLAQRRTLLHECRKSTDRHDVKKQDQQVAARREAKLADLSASKQIAKVDKRVKDAHVALERMAAKKDKLDEEMQTLQQKLANHTADLEKAKLRIAEAESQRVQVYATLRPQSVKEHKVDMLDSAGDSIASVLAASALLPAEIFTKIGSNQADLRNMLQGLADQVAMHQKQAEQAREEEAKAKEQEAKTAETPTAAAAAAEAAATATKSRAWADTNDDEASDMEVDSETLDAVRRKLPANLGEQVKIDLAIDIAKTMASGKVKTKVKSKAVVKDEVNGKCA